MGSEQERKVVLEEVVSSVAGALCRSRECDPAVWGQKLFDVLKARVPLPGPEYYAYWFGQAMEVAQTQGDVPVQGGGESDGPVHPAELILTDDPVVWARTFFAETKGQAADANEMRDWFAFAIGTAKSFARREFERAEHRDHIHVPLTEWDEEDDDEDGETLVEMVAEKIQVRLYVNFINGRQEVFPIFATDRWGWRVTLRDGVPFLIIRQDGGKTGRADIPLVNVLWWEVEFATPRGE
jgi:hypothetical protein